MDFLPADLAEAGSIACSLQNHCLLILVMRDLAMPDQQNRSDFLKSWTRKVLWISLWNVGDQWKWVTNCLLYKLYVKIVDVIAVYGDAILTESVRLCVTGIGIYDSSVIENATYVCCMMQTGDWYVTDDVNAMKTAVDALNRTEIEIGVTGSVTENVNDLVPLTFVCVMVNVTVTENTASDFEPIASNNFCCEAEISNVAQTDRHVAMMTECDHYSVVCQSLHCGIRCQDFGRRAKSCSAGLLDISAGGKALHNTQVYIINNM